MSLPIKEIPAEFRDNISDYKCCFTRPQYANFKDLVFGHIVSDSKTIQEIADCYGRVDQSSLNRFVTESDWDEKEVNDVRINQIKEILPIKKGIFIIDPTFLHKTGRHMEMANYLYSGITKGKEWGHCLVNSFFTDGKHEFPICADFFIRKDDANDLYPFKTIREICIEQLDYAMSKLPIWLFMADAGLYADFLIKEIKSRDLKYIIGTKVSNNISINRKKRINIRDYLNSLTDKDFNHYVINGEVYFLHTIDVSERHVGKEKLLISYKQGDEENIRLYVTNIFNLDNESIMKLLLKRWTIEVWHHDAKQHLGLEDYQVRKYHGIQKVVPVILVAYTQIILMKSKVLQKLGRKIATIGEGCRYLRLLALKGSYWLKQKAKDLSKLAKIMNRQVFVKNAKV